jgi:hypothetical protein
MAAISAASAAVPAKERVALLLRQPELLPVPRAHAP